MNASVENKDSSMQIKGQERNVVLVGTSHVSEESMMLIRGVLDHFQADVIAVELDRQRVASLDSEKSASFFQVMRVSGFFGAFFYALGRFLQQNIGKSLGIKPGSEMKGAIALAREKKIDVALIDQDISITLANMKGIPAREKFRFFWDMITGRMAADKELKGIDIRKIPEDEIVDSVISLLEKRYPRFYNVLVGDRNRVMARNIERLSEHYDNILAVVGKGHVNGMRDALRSRSFNVKIARLSDKKPSS